MGGPAARVPTFDELYRQIERLPEGVTGEILERGTLRTMSRPGGAHRRAAKLAGESLRGFDRTLGGTGWWIEVEAEIRFPLDRLAVPDLAGWRVERVPTLPNENLLTVLPDWCCEVLSPSTSRVDRVLKPPLYVQSGVAWVWLIDPEQRTLEVYESVNGRATLALAASEHDAVTAPPFDAPLALGDFWMPREATAP